MAEVTRTSPEFDRLRPQDVLVAVIVHVPHLRGYFTNRMGVLELCIESLLQTKPGGVPLLVFDNGSCLQVERLLSSWLRDGRLDFLLRSRINIGKLAALRIVAALHLRPLLAYSDDDVYYEPGWLQAQLSLLAAFRQAGMVSAVPTVDGGSKAIASTLAWAQTGSPVSLISESTVPAAWESEWARSTGRDPEEHLRRNAGLRLPQIVRGDQRAFVGAVHFQFLAPVACLEGCLPKSWPDRLMGGMRELDECVDRAGYLRLSTSQRYVQHMGNEVGPALREQAERTGICVRPAASLPRLTSLERLPLRSRRVRRIVWKGYRRLGLLLDGEGIRPKPMPSRTAAQPSGVEDPEAAAWRDS